MRTAIVAWIVVLITTAVIAVATIVVATVTWIVITPRPCWRWHRASMGHQALEFLAR